MSLVRDYIEENLLKRGYETFITSPSFADLCALKELIKEEIKEHFKKETD